MERRERFRLLVEGTDSLMCEMDAEGRFIYVNPACKTILGHDLSGLIGTEVLTLVHPEDAEIAGQSLFPLDGAAKRSKATFRLHHRNGDWRWFEASTTSYQSSPGEHRILFIAKDVSESHRSEEISTKALVEKDLMMKELQHRVKNSLAIVSSLLSLKKDSLRDKPSIEVFRSTQARIRSIGGLYEELYRSSENDKVDFRLYIEHLAGSIMETYGAESENIKLVSELDEVHLDTRRAISLGLIVNELITNSIKYAYVGRTCGEIGITLSQLGSYIILSVSDHGVGMPEGFDTRDSPGLGLALVRSFSQ
ncbi:MAG: histidine kinase dimerization/phosphoacceptor domain -containing protein, partial [Spirochaetota bacterium]